MGYSEIAEVGYLKFAWLKRHLEAAVEAEAVVEAGWMAEERDCMRLVGEGRLMAEAEWLLVAGPADRERRRGSWTKRVDLDAASVAQHGCHWHCCCSNCWPTLGSRCPALRWSNRPNGPESRWPFPGSH